MTGYQQAQKVTPIIFMCLCVYIYLLILLIYIYICVSVCLIYVYMCVCMFTSRIYIITKECSISRMYGDCGTIKARTLRTGLLSVLLGARMLLTGPLALLLVTRSY